MIDPKELRIGNLALSPGIDYDQEENKRRDPEGDEILTVDTQLLIEISKYPDAYEPIPLTEEWLLRFGFETADCEIDFMEYTKEYEKDSHVYSVCNRGGFDGHAENPFYVTISEGQKNGWSHDHEIEIKHVHQLQNFHFAMTNQELTIKTPVEV